MTPADPPITRRLRMLAAVTQVLPISWFGLAARAAEPGVVDGWRRAFLIGAAVAVVDVVVRIVTRARPNWIFLSANVFLLAGGLSFVLGLDPVLAVYERWRESMLFAVMLVVGLVTLVLARDGFVGQVHPDRVLVRVCSAILLAAVAAVFVVTMKLDLHPAVSGAIPFIGLFLLGRGLALVMRRRSP